ncbi:MAG: hypothetical protein HOP29_08830 [Phycisphaerales bacterium]|nr:hypothetical protein [Phycisphaerales bacterium]
MVISANGSANGDPPIDPKPPVIRSNVPTPPSWDQDGMFKAFKTADETVDWISLTDPLEWWHATDAAPEKSRTYQNQQWQNYLIQQHKLNVFIQLDPYAPPRTGPLSKRLPDKLKDQTFASPAVRQAFIAESVARVKWYNASMVCLAMEINAYYDEQPDDFDNFISLFVETRNEIKKIKPDAVVLVSFQYESLLGRYPELGPRHKHEPQWHLFEKFEPHVDAFGLSSYPMEGMNPPRFGDPADLPDDYYSRVSAHTKKPIVFAELGYASDDKYGGSQERQAAFLRRFGKLTDGMNLLLVNYYFLYDVQGFGPVFSSMGLLDSAGNPKKALDVWKSMWNE